LWPRRDGPPGLPFVCVPAGTRNHFALDLGVDRHDLVGAVEAFGDHGVERSIDVAEVNGRVFLNNVSPGIYGDAVQHNSHRDAKVRTLLETTAEVLGPSRAAPNVLVVDDVGHEHRGPAVVLVSNNPYALRASRARRSNWTRRSRWRSDRARCASGSSRHPGVSPSGRLP
jgi:diacylglycerol kinase family enzyme